VEQAQRETSQTKFLTNYCLALDSEVEVGEQHSVLKRVHCYLKQLLNLLKHNRTLRTPPAINTNIEVGRLLFCTKTTIQKVRIWMCYS
jgi:hypothetical protein